MKLVHAFAALFLFACSSPPPDASTTAQGIQGGYAWGGDYAVGMIGFVGGGVCSGTLIAPDVVLTAGHCIQSEEIDAFYLGPGAPLLVTTDDPTPRAIPTNLRRYAVDKVAIYPGFDVSKLNAGEISKDAPDLGLLHLAERVLDVRPMEIVTPDDANAPYPGVTVGGTCWIVGYGRHDVAGQTTVKEKRGAEVKITSLSEDQIETTRPAAWNGGIADEGDSGGPLLCIVRREGDEVPRERIAGTVSYALDATGNSGMHEHHETEYYVRVASYAAWIQGALSSFPVEERCTIVGGVATFDCAKSTLRYCDGERWRTMMTCAAGQTCDAVGGTCR